MHHVRVPKVRRMLGLVALGLAAALVAAGCGSSDNGPVTAGNSGGAKSLSGAGATFPAPAYEQIFADFGGKNGVQVNYQAIGSGGGISQFTAGTVDFGATDSPMKDDELQQAEAKGGTVIHVPTMLGAIVVTYNLPQVTQTLKMDGQLIGDIFLRKVKNWNDQAIAAQNAGVTLPDKPILTAHRSDGSGTTDNFTKFVAAHNAEFMSKVGQGKEVNWVGGVGGKGNDGVTAAVKQTDGAVGYVELNYALTNNLKFADVKNSAGQYITPSLDSTSAAASDLSAVPADFRASLVDSKAADAYPIATWTFLIVFQKQSDAAKGRTLANLLWYTTHEGQAPAKTLDYAPLPTSVVPKIEATIKGITGPDGAALYTGQ
ncbi:MAG TPA: phosphate ABC transporter substrate-binding protein PstS [Actinomycetes bacterium]|nr:phosphate ABC transporter substrate-binding protein PstS [Actinomycetes bacterium]